MKARVLTLIAVLCAFALPAQSYANSYPQKAVHLVVGFPPGGSNDILARLVGQKLSELWGQPVVVDNKPGANAIIATELVAKAAADGYTLLIGASGAMTVNPSVYEKLPYDPRKDFAPVTLLASFPLVMAVHPSVPAKSLQEFIQLAKTQPGKLNYASGSTPFQLAAEMFKLAAGADIAHIPYKGSAASVVATMSGDTQFLVVDVPPAVQQIKAGKLRGLAITGPKRSAELPDLPTVAEASYPEVESVLWTGLFAPAGTPQPVIDKLGADVAKVLQQQDVQKRLAEMGFEPGGGSPEQTAAKLKADLEKWGKVAREARVKAE